MSRGEGQVRGFRDFNRAKEVLELLLELGLHVFTLVWLRVTSLRGLFRPPFAQVPWEKYLSSGIDPISIQQGQMEVERLQPLPWLGLLLAKE